MAIAFPSAPSINDTYTVNGRTYVWNGTTWRTIKAPVPDVLPTLSVDNDFSAGGVLHVDSENSEIGIGTAAPSHQLHLTQDLGVDGNLIVGGTITVPTPTAGTNDTTAATTAFVQNAISSKQDSSTALTTSTSFGGDVSGTYNAIVISDDSHNHVISNVDGLQTALDAKQNSSTALTTSTAFSGDVSGTYDAMVVADDSHNHIISNVDGLQTALDAKLPSSSYTAADVLTKIKTVDGAGSGLDADTLDGVQGDNYALKTYVDTAVSNLVDAAPTTLDTLNELAAALGDDPNFATTVAASIGTKLDSSAYTASDVLTKIKTVDGTGSGLDADTLDGIQGANFLRSDTSDSMTGTLTATAFSGPLTGNVTGNADTATKLATARTISLTGDVTGSASFDGSANASITATVADDSHNHIISNVDGLQTALDGKAASSHTHAYLSTSGGTVTGNLDITGYLSVDTGTLHTDITNNRVGIGTTSPATTLDVAGSLTASGSMVANGGISGLTLANGISGNNFNITGVNQIEIADPGEGIIWKGGASGDISLIVVDDASDNILRTSAAQFQVGTNTVWHAGNDGSGSGLDADLLDGNHASAFATSSHTHAYLSTSGGTVTGNLTTQGNMYIGKNGGGDSWAYFYDDNSNAWREFGWDDSANRFVTSHSITANTVVGAVFIGANGTDIYGTAGRNYFKDSEKSTGSGLRVGAAWGYYGIYSESGDAVVGAQTGTVRFNNDGARVVGAALYGSNVDSGGGRLTGNWGGIGAPGVQMRSGNTFNTSWTGTLQLWVDYTYIKSFVIDHPSNPEEQWLVHACSEGPTADVFYRGEAQLSDGLAVIELPEYFEDLTELEGRTIMVTPIANPSKNVANLAAYEISNGRFVVEQVGGYNVPNQRFWWRVDAVRKNTTFPVQPKKNEVVIGGSGPYKYIQEMV